MSGPARRLDLSRYYVFPASYAQERLWFLSQLEPDSGTAYHVRSAVRVDGPLDRVAFQGALNRVMARHESLRTGIALVDGEPRQIVLPEAVLAVPVVDCASLGEADQPAEVQRILEREAGREFVLDDPPLIRVVLVRLAADRHVLVLVMHHLICDGWSVGVFLEHLAAAYDEVRAGTADDDEPPPQYADYTVWQREALAGDALAGLTGYWRDQLTGLAPMELPTDHTRPAVRGAAGAACRQRLPAELAERLRRHAADGDATLFMALLAGFTVLLSRYAGQSDVAVGTTVANRTLPELEQMIGLFVNTVVLRTDVSGDPTFRQLVSRVRQTCLGAYAHQELPFEKVVEELRPPRDLSRTPLFGVMFQLQNLPATRIVLDELTFTPLPDRVRTAKFDLTLVATPGDDGIDLALEYRTDLFGEATVARILRQYITLLGHAADRPDEPLSGLPLLEPDERRLVLSEWSYGPRRPVPDGLLHERVAAQARRTPDAVAVEGDGGRLTYAELVAYGGALAGRLHRAGVRPGDVVAVCAGRDLPLVAGLLGVLAAGVAYLPVDPGYPGERIRYLLRDSGVTHVLATPRAAATLPDGDWRLVPLDLAPEPDAAPVVPAAADRLAYVVYTSGSTGRPKGVAVGHRSLVNHLDAMAGLVGVGAADVLAAVSSVSFDIAGLELFLPLLYGARVVVVGEDDVGDGARLAARLAGCGATLMQATPATWRLLLAAGWRPDTGPRALCGGEALDTDLAERLSAGGAELWNLYGPTEATIWASGGRVTDPARIRLGDPLAGTTRYVLDAALRPVPVGVAGELYLGGAAVAYGYRGRAGLTAERFLPDPYGQLPGGRLYRTGDLCRYRRDGGLEFLGRTDDQVKVRGYRIEPGEIEAALAGHPDVAHAAVVTHQVAPGDVRLVAYLVPRPELARGADADGELLRAVREAVAARLPGYLVPSGFALRDALPLTPAGKVDRAALRRLPPPTGGEGIDDTPPRTPVEEQVAAAFAEVLGLARVGVHASFFDLGGHSLLAARLVAELHRRTGVHLLLRDLFHRPTVAAVAEAIATRQDTAWARREDAALRDLVAGMSDTEVEALLRQAADPSHPRMPDLEANR